MKLVDLDANRDDFLIAAHSILGDEPHNKKLHKLMKVYDSMHRSFDLDKVEIELQDIINKLENSTELERLRPKAEAYKNTLRIIERAKSFRGSY